MTHSDFSDTHALHNGNNYLAPVDLAITPTIFRRVLIVGSCLADVWQNKAPCSCDFVTTNNLNQLSDAPPHPIEDYDLQLIQIPLRFILPDDTFWHLSFLDIEAHQHAFEQSCARLKQYLELVTFWNKKYGILTFVSNFFVPQQNAMGSLAPRYDLRNPVYFIEQLNFQLAQQIILLPNIYLLDIDSISSALGKKHVQDDAVELQNHGSFLGNSNYDKDKERIDPIERMTDHYKLHTDYFILVLWQQILAMYKTIRQGDAVKLVILDLDNTLWRGVIAEENEISDQTIEGWPLGLIEALCYLKKRGVLLAIASKNNEETITRLWDKIMLGRLRLSDFAAVKINWNPKTESIEEILSLINILPQNTLFIDDNPVERAAVQAAFPAIRVLGQYPYYLKRILLWAPETQVSVVTPESTKRTELIKAQTVRETVRKQMSREEFLASLKVEVDFAHIASTEHPSFDRAFELLNKTNQFNTTGQRWTREECETRFKEDWDFVSFIIKDRFADYGLTACAWISGNTIEQFVMSCRTIGLDVENKIIDWLATLMAKNGLTEIVGRIVETKANFPCRDVYARCGFTKNGGLWRKPLV